jgi:polyisoprenoid-binding protein YceI
LIVLGLGLATAGAVLAGWGGAAPGGPATLDQTPFTIDKVHTSAVFRVQRTNGAPYYGRFNDISGTFLLNHEDPSRSMIDVTIDVASVDTNNQGRDRHLRSADFFAAEEYPTARFVSRSFTRVGEMEYDVTGDLTIRGTTRAITARVRQTGQGPARRGEMCGLDVTFTIRRSEFGVSYGPGVLSDEVRIMAGLEGNRDK